MVINYLSIALFLIILPLVTYAEGNLFSTLGPQTAAMTQVILLTELIYTVDASDDPNSMARPFCPAVRWKTL